MGIGIKRGECVGGGDGTAFRQEIADLVTEGGVTTSVTDTDAVIIANLNKAGEIVYANAVKSVTVSQSRSSNVVTATASNGATASTTVPLGTDSGSLTFTLTPTGNNNTTKALAEGYYKAGTVTANGATSYTAGQNSVTLSSAVSGRTVTTTASNGKTSSGSVALGTGSGSLSFTLTPTGNNTATKAMTAGYYNAGTITANGATAYAAGKTAAINAASVSATVSSFSTGTQEKDNGHNVVDVKGCAQGTAVLENGVLTLTIEVWAYGKARNWSNEELVHPCELTTSHKTATSTATLSV